MVESSASSNPDPGPNRPSFKSFWKKSKQVLGAKTIRFVDSNPTKESGPDKAQLRRAQVRRAQMQHRQRKASYVRQLEMDVARIRGMIEAAERESQVLLDENQAMRAQLRNAAATDVSLPVSLPVSIPMSPDTVASLRQELDAVTITLGFDEIMDAPAFYISSPPPPAYPCPPFPRPAAPSPAALPDLTPSETQAAINFILALEHICRDHFHPSLYHPPAPEDADDADGSAPPPQHNNPFDFFLGNDSNGHTLMATSLALRNAPAHIFKAAARTRPLPGVNLISRRPSVPPLPPPPPPPPAPSSSPPPPPPAAHPSAAADDSTGLSWKTSGLTLRSLYGLACSLNPPSLADGGEITPVQAWFELVARFGAATLMQEVVLDQLKRGFVRAVKCPHFGASMKRRDFERIVGLVIGKHGW